jgi:amidase
VPTTAGSLALASNVTHRDAPVVARLRAAGAIILGKTNLSEWANIRSTHSISGWSAIGGWTRNPNVLDRSTCGSSAGSGAAVAASLAAAALGTETNGSLVCPGSFNGIVSLKPTVGLVSRTHIVPISHTQDTAGPMTRGVADAALLLAAMAGSDAEDPATSEADARRADYAALAGASLTGKRLGVIVPPPEQLNPAVGALLEQAFAILRAQGATVILIEAFVRPPGASEEESTVLKYELKHDMAAYLQSLPGTGPKTLDDLIAFNAASPRETVLFDQDYFLMSNAMGDLRDPVYVQAHDDLVKTTRALLDRTLAQNHLDALIRATDDPAFRVDVVHTDNDGPSASFLPATSGYPHLTVPMGYVNGLPVGLSFIGPAWSEAQLLGLGAAFERAANARRPPAYLPSLESTPAMAAALAPLPR